MPDQPGTAEPSIWPWLLLAGILYFAWRIATSGITLRPFVFVAGMFLSVIALDAMISRLDRWLGLGEYSFLLALLPLVAVALWSRRRRWSWRFALPQLWHRAKPSANYDLGRLLQLSPGGFEDAVADLLRDLGFRFVQQVGGAGDLGSDIECRDEAGQRVIVQCKLHRPGIRVGSPPIQMFLGAIAHYGARYGIFVSTSAFTPSAVDFATHHCIYLIDQEGIARLAAEASRSNGTKTPSKTVARSRVTCA